MYGAAAPDQDEETGWLVQRVYLAEAFGWKLEYIDGLSYEDVQAILGVWDGKSKAQESGE